MIERLASDAAVAKSGALARILAVAFDAPEQRWSADSLAGALSIAGTVAFVVRVGGSLKQLPPDQCERSAIVPARAPARAAPDRPPGRALSAPARGRSPPVHSPSSSGGNGIKACALLRIVADEGEILTLAVLPAARRQGLGSRLLAACIDEAGAAGARRLHLEVSAANAAARVLYAGAGFVEAGRRAGYYRAAHGREDAVIMARDVARS